MTAPAPNTRTVLVVSEKGSRLSLPSMVRAPFTVTGISSATGCCFAAESLDAACVDPGRTEASGVAVSVSESFVMEGMTGTLARSRIFLRPCPEWLPAKPYLYMFGFCGAAQHSTRVPQCSA